MPKKSYAERISAAQVMSAGLSANLERMGRRGIDEDFLNTLVEGTNASIVLNNEQEKLKADLKKKTEELDQQLSVVNKQLSEARKVVKLEFPQSAWKEFGIDAKK